MNFSWFGLLIFALIAVAVSAGRCPKDFKKDGNKCVADRPIRGHCPENSEYSLRINKCVYNK